MNAWLIFLGVVLLIWPALVLAQFIILGIYEILANNWHEYLIVPGLIALTFGGGWALLVGFGVW